MPHLAPRLALLVAASTAGACSRTPAGPDASAQAQAAASASAHGDTALAPPVAPSGVKADDTTKPPGPNDDTTKPAGSAAHDPGRYRAPVVMTVRGGSGAQPGPIVVTLDVREPVQAPATLALSYALAGGGLGRKTLNVSLAKAGTQTHTVALAPEAQAPVRVTLDASDPARGAGLHAERSWPENAVTPPPRPPGGPPGGRPPFAAPPRAPDAEAPKAPEGSPP